MKKELVFGSFGLYPEQITLETISALRKCGKVYLTCVRKEQAGLLRGRSKKERTRAESRPTSVAYALLLGDLCGRRGRALFDTLWARILDAPVHVLREQAIVASQQGWIEYRAAGDVVEASFRHLMRDAPGGRP